MSASIIILPLVRIEAYTDNGVRVVRPAAIDRAPSDVDLANQVLNPSSDRRNVVDLARARDIRDWAKPRPQPPCDCEGD